MTKGHCSSKLPKCWIPPFNIPQTPLPLVTTVFSDPGKTVFTIPNGVTSVEYFVIGGGGGGAGNGLKKASIGGGGGGGRGLFLSGSINLTMGNTIIVNVGFGGSGGYNEGNTGGASIIYYGVQTITAPGGNPGLKGGLIDPELKLFSSTGGNGGDYSGGGGGGGSSVEFEAKQGGIGGQAGQGSAGQNGEDSFLVPFSPPVGGTGGNGGNGISFLTSSNTTLSGIPGLGGIGGLRTVGRGGGGGGAGGVGSNNPLIQAKNGASSPENGKGGFGYGSGGGGATGRNSKEAPSPGGDGFYGLIVLKYKL